MTKDERARELLEYLEKPKPEAPNRAPQVSDIRWEPFTEGEQP